MHDTDTVHANLGFADGTTNSDLTVAGRTTVASTAAARPKQAAQAVVQNEGGAAEQNEAGASRGRD